MTTYAPRIVIFEGDQHSGRTELADEYARVHRCCHNIRRVHPLASWRYQDYLGEIKISLDNLGEDMTAVWDGFWGGEVLRAKMEGRKPPLDWHETNILTAIAVELKAQIVVLGDGYSDGDFRPFFIGLNTPQLIIRAGKNARLAEIILKQRRDSVIC